MELVTKYRFDREHESPRIAVIGDVMLDAHVECDVLGISPEDDLAYKLRIKRSTYSQGGAANVAQNIKSLGSGEVRLFGVTGDDAAGAALRNQSAPGSFVCSDGRPTTVKTRYTTPRGRHIVRVDAEVTDPISDVTATSLIQDLARFQPTFIVVSDYAKGVVTDFLMHGIRSLNIPFIADPKHTDFSRYRGALALTPNEKEFRAATQSNGKDLLDECATSLVGVIDNTCILVTLAGAGAHLFSYPPGKGVGSLAHLAVRKREFGDPCGCGDSLIAALAYAYACHWPIFLACGFAVAAGACAFDHEGAYTVKPDDLVKELSAFNYW